MNFSPRNTMIAACCLLTAFMFCNAQTLENLDLGTCRLSCNQAMSNNRPPDVPTNPSQGRPGKRGMKGEAGRKGEKGDPCQCFLQTHEEVERVRNHLKNLQDVCPQTKYFFPRSRQTSDYLRLKAPVGDMNSVSVCAWVTPLKGKNLKGTLVSYNNDTKDNILLVIFTENNVEVYTSSQNHVFAIHVTHRTYLCLTISNQSRQSKIYINGSLASTKSFGSIPLIVGGGVMLIGQEQDSLLGSFDKNQALSGTLENLMIWNRKLEEHEIQAMHNNKFSCAKHHTIALTPNSVSLVGKVRAEMPEDY